MHLTLRALLIGVVLAMPSVPALAQSAPPCAALEQSMSSLSQSLSTLSTLTGEMRSGISQNNAVAAFEASQTITTVASGLVTTEFLFDGRIAAYAQGGVGTGPITGPTPAGESEQLTALVNLESLPGHLLMVPSLQAGSQVTWSQLFSQTLRAEALLNAGKDARATLLTKVCSAAQFRRLRLRYR